jgi:hypothetical protein
MLRSCNAAKRNAVQRRDAARARERGAVGGAMGQHGWSCMGLRSSHRGGFGGLKSPEVPGSDFISSMKTRQISVSVVVFG